MDVSEDGLYRWIVAHDDPGVRNWVDTTGLGHGFLTVRYTYQRQPPKEDWPTLSVEKVALADVRDRLPSETRSVTQADRESAILLRHRHVQRRYRQ